MIPPTAEQRARYEACCQKVYEAIKTHLEANAHNPPILLFRYPRQVALIATLGDAERRRLLMVNDAGRLLVQAAKNAVPINEEPTILMFRACYEMAKEAGVL